MTKGRVMEWWRWRNKSESVEGQVDNARPYRTPGQAANQTPRQYDMRLETQLNELTLLMNIHGTLNPAKCCGLAGLNAVVVHAVDDTVCMSCDIITSHV